MPAARLYSEQDVADYLGVPPASVKQWRYLGTGPKFIKVGKHVRYRETDLEAWLKEQTRTVSTRAKA